MLAEAFPLGNWKSLIEMEKCITLNELNLLLSKLHEKEYEDKKFAAAIKGIDLEDNRDSSFDEIKARVDAELAGKTPEEHFFGIVGIEVESDEED